MSLNLPDANRTVGDKNHTSDTNLIIDAINSVKSQVDGIPAGEKGEKGDPGEPGAPGLAATITVANTVTSAPGSNAAVTEGGTAQNRQLTFTIPRGVAGPAGAPGPQGPIGPQGDTGPQGPIGTVTPELQAAKVAAEGAATNAAISAAKAADWADKTDGAVETGRFSAKFWADQAEQAVIGGDVLTPDNVRTVTNKTISGSNNTLSNINPTSITGTAVVNNDARLTDARTPTAHASTHELGGSDELELDPTQVTGTAVVDSDSRLTDARTPVAHADSHEQGGTDELELAPEQITGTAVVDNDSRLTDDRYPTAHAASHESGGDDELELAPDQITGTALTESELSDTAASELSDTASAGTSGEVSRADHVHDIMYDVPAGAVTYDTSPVGITDTEGKTFWDPDFGTLSLVMTGGNVTLPIGQKSGAEVKNKTGSTIVKGTVVQFDGASGGNIEIAPAVNDGSVNPRFYLGVAAENILDDDEGFVVETGYIRPLNTNAWPLGTLLYIGASGALTDTPPAKPAFQIPVAAVTRQDASAGVIYVRMDNGLELNEVFDVDAGSAVADDSLVYDGSAWENKRLIKVHYEDTEPSTGIATGDVWVDFGSTA